MGLRLSRTAQEPQPSATQAPVPSHFKQHQEDSCQGAQGHEQTDHDTTATSATSSDTPLGTDTPPSDSDAMDVDQPPRETTEFDSSASRELLQQLPGDYTFACLICNTQCDGDDTDSPKATFPCSRCGSPFCAPCLKGMFVDACKDLSRMPPRCCNQIPLHHVRPYLSPDEVDLFKAKYDEWGTPNPFYCPVARCSTFIPNYLLPSTGTNGKGKQRADSGVGTPTMSTVSCPECEANICTSCRNLAHEDGVCKPPQFYGIDEKTAELIEQWGYKRCPKCGNGVKRMFGCSHMECRCGAHFCWGCLKSNNCCDGSCGEGSEDDDYSDYEPDSESEFGQDEEKEQEQDQSLEPFLAHVLEHLAPASSTDDVSAKPAPETAPSNIETAPSNIETAPSNTTPEEETQENENVPPPRIRNLDGGANGYWEERIDLDFGEEPNEDYKDRMWSCSHEFHTTKLTLAEAFFSHNSDTVIECMKCWARIHPEITMPVTTKTVAWTTATTGKRRRIEVPSKERNGHAAGLRGSRSMEDLDAGGSSTVQLSSSPASFRSAYAFSARADAQDALERPDRVVDLYGNTVALSKMPGDTGVDGGAIEWTPCEQGEKGLNAVAGQTKGTPFSFAYECETCGVLVCQGCKEHLENVVHPWSDEE